MYKLHAIPYPKVSGVTIISSTFFYHKVKIIKHEQSSKQFIMEYLSRNQNFQLSATLIALLLLFETKLKFESTTL